jgi:hypothetical protein
MRGEPFELAREFPPVRGGLRKFQGAADLTNLLASTAAIPESF